MHYRVQLETFQGPLDLLLFLVKRQEVDICDIPIAQVTDQFLQYLEIIEKIDVERAGDFLVMAATLMEIKSHMLLPRSEAPALENPDPRLDLVKQLMDYKRFKEAAALLEAQEQKNCQRVARQPTGAVELDNFREQPIQQVELWDLVSAFGRLMRETLALQPQQIVVDETPTHVYQEEILKRLKEEKRLSLECVFTPPHTRARLVGMFLSILELIKCCRVTAEQDEDFGQIWLSAVA
jgi:segregation and condensation protein A